MIMDSERSQHRVCVSPCSQFLACCSTDESVRVWNTLSGKQVHQFLPSKQLTTPVSCLQFTHKNFNKSNGGSGCVLVLGTVDGRLVLYDYSAGNVLKEISATSGNARITALRWASPTTLAVLAMDNTLAIWNMEKGTSTKQFSVLGHTSLCLLSPTAAAIANQSIEVLQINQARRAVSDVTTVQVSAGTLLQKFTGHASQTTCLEIAGKQKQGQQYLISASCNDIFVRVWKLDRGAPDTMMNSSCCVLQAVEQVASVTVGDGTVGVISITGTLRIFRANYKRFDSQKPLQPEGSLTLYSGRNSGKNSGRKLKCPVPIVKAFNLTNKDVTIAYGVGVCLQFERVPLCNLRGTVKLVRAPTDAFRATNTQAHELAADLVHRKVAHATPALMPIVKKGKRKAGEDDPDTKNLPMEELLTAMTSSTPCNHTTLSGEGGLLESEKEDLSSVAKKSQAHLLIQGLHSNDQKLLLRVLSNRDLGVIHRTVASLPISAVVPLITVLHSFLPTCWHLNTSFTMWMREVLASHSSFLSSLPNKVGLLQPFLQYCAARRASLPRVQQLQNRLDLNVLQWKKEKKVSTKLKTTSYTPLMVVSDDSSDNEDFGIPSSPSRGAPLTNGHASHSEMSDDSDLEEDNERSDDCEQASEDERIEDEEMEVSEEDQDESEEGNNSA